MPFASVVRCLQPSPPLVKTVECLMSNGALCLPALLRDPYSLICRSVSSSAPNSFSAWAAPTSVWFRRLFNFYRRRKVKAGPHGKMICPVELKFGMFVVILLIKIH